MRYLVAGLTVLACALAVTSARAEVFESERGNTYVSDGVGKDDVVPVVIVEGGLATDAAKLWPLLSARTKLVMVETPSLRSMLDRPEGGGLVTQAVDGALEEAAKHHDVDRCPWIVVAFSKAAPHLANLVLSDPERFQGLVVANGAPPDGALLVDRTRLEGFEVLVLNSAEDKVSPLAQARAFTDLLHGAGASVEGKSLLTDDHMAVLGPESVAAMGGLLARAAARPVPTRPLARPWRTIETKSKDGLVLTADLWETGSPTAPILLLFHQARSSRGEYRPIARRLVEEGYNCLALDARSGAQWAGVLNETAARARKEGKADAYLDARQDLERAIAWARELGFTGRLAIWGSSYSAALSMFVGQEAEVTAVLAFSPGDYLPPKGSTPAAAAKLSKPVLVVCAPKEEAGARVVFERIASAEKELYVHPGGLHGSRTLYVSADPAPAWARVLAFLEARLLAD